jgi:hypothetical protein
MWRYIHNFSIDVALGSVCCASMFARACDISFPLYLAIGLMSAVLLIYHVDHYYDAKRIHAHLGIHHMSQRRQFHWQYRKILVASIIASIVIDLVIATYLPTTLYILGGIWAIICGIYLYLSHRRVIFAKEPMIAIVYASALVLWPICQMIDLQLQLPWVLYWEWGTLTLIALLNLLIFSYFEKDDDLREQAYSWLSHYSPNQTYRLCVFIISTLVILHILGLYMFSTSIWVYSDQWILLMMTLTLTGLFIFPQWSQVHKRYRLWGDIIFCYPGLIILIQSVLSEIESNV